MVELQHQFAFMEDMNMDDYAEQAMETAIYPDKLIYPMLGLQGEVGELSEKLKKYFRDEVVDILAMEEPEEEISAELRLEMAKECGDILWYLTAICNDLGYCLSEVADLNLNKLKSRAKRNKLRGSGDNR